jgi:hypothetical protein
MKCKNIRVLFALPISVIGPTGLLFVFLGAKLSETRFDTRLLIASLSVFVLFIFSYSVVLNEALLRGASLILINYILYSVIRSHSWSESALYVSDIIYIVNISILVLGSVFEPVAMLFSRVGVGVGVDGGDRVGGIIGYDFVAFFVSIYIIARIEAGRLNLGWPLFFHLGVATFVTLNSGRFGVLILLLLYIRVLMSFGSIKMILMICTCSLGLLVVNSDRVNLIVNTVLGVYEYLSTDRVDILNTISAAKPSGFYGASPVTWINESALAFGNLSDNLLPSQFYSVVDNGPAYMILNYGLILTTLTYFLLYYFLRRSHASHFIVFSILFFTDLKFRSVFTVFIMFWIYINFLQVRKYVIAN